MKWLLPIIILPLAVPGYCQKAGQNIESATDGQISGVVVDESGRPLSDVLIKKSDREVIQRSNAEGRFVTSATFPRILFIKPGYWTKLIRVQDINGVLRVVMEGSGTANEFPVCSSGTHCQSVDGFGPRLCFPRLPGVEYGEQRNDADYGQRSFTVKSRGGNEGIYLAGGPM